MSEKPSQAINNDNKHEAYPANEHVSSGIHALGKFALDPSEEYINTMISKDDLVTSRQERHDMLVHLGAPDIIIKKEEELIQNARDIARAKIEEYKDPEKYREIMESWKSNALNELVSNIVNENGSFTYMDRVKRLNSILNIWQPSPYIDQILQPGINDKTGKKGYLRAILKKNENNEYIVTTEQLRNFFQWHNYEHRKAEDELTEQTPVHKAMFRQSLEQAVANNTIPKNALTNIDRINDVSFILDDGLSSIVKRTGGTHEIDYISEGSIITLAPDKAKSFHVIVHELFHDIQGRDVDSPSINTYMAWTEQTIPCSLTKHDDEDSDVFHQHSSEDLKKIKTYQKAMITILEATTEGLASKLNNTPKNEQSYIEYQNFLSSLIENSNGQLTMQDFEEAFFENSNDKFNDFINRIQSAYPNVNNIIFEIGKIKKWEPAPKQAKVKGLMASHTIYPQYSKDIQKFRFQTNQTYLDYLKSV